MNALTLIKNKSKTDKKLQENFKKKQKEAFEQFLKVHAVDPFFQEYILKSYF